MSALPSTLRYSRRLQPGYRTRLTQRGRHSTLAMPPAGKWKHPWETTPSWSPDDEQWAATIEPGFVNSYGSAGTDPTPTVNGVALYDTPLIPLNFYGIGFDGDPNHGVPEYFFNLGAAPAAQQSQSDIENGVPPTPPKGLRLLRASDLWVHQPRLALTSTIALEPGIATGLSNVTQTLGISFPVGDTLRILNGVFTPLTSFTAGIDPLDGDYTEPAYDEILISTVYVLSPPDVPLGSTPDSSWTPYVRHNLFWNLNWAQPYFSPLDVDPGTPLIPPLAGGAAQLIINFLTASLNDATEQALTLLTAHSMAGSFWTPTGGGTDATFAALATAQAVQSGPDKGKNAAAKLSAIQAQARVMQLDPDFPYHGQPIPLSLLSLS